jgi:predicted CXXCH cytochrome family protein
MRKAQFAVIAFAIIAATVTIGTGGENPSAAIDAGQIQKMWEASSHSKTLGLIINNDKASADCYACHSAEGFAAKLQGKKVDIANKASFSAVTCAACHELKNSNNPYKLVMDSEDLCISCHKQDAVLKGKGAAGIEETRSFHSAIPCVSCHMTEKNHKMKVLRPDSPDLSENRIDTCTACHRDNNRSTRVTQIQQWQTSYQKNVDALEVDLKTIGNALKEKPDALSPEMKKKFTDAQKNLSLLASDGSRGAHNADFTSAILTSAAKSFREIKSVLK